MTARPKPPIVFRVVVAIVRPLVRLVTRPQWSGAEHLPDGPFIAVANHISVFDPLTLLDYLTGNGVWPCVLAKESLWRVPVLGWVLRKVKAVPVHRESASARGALVDAEAALASGYAVLLFPEGTTTQDPHTWPMAAKTGAARLALRTRATVVPLTQWGAHTVINTDATSFTPLPPKPVVVVGSPPIDLSDLVDRAEDRAAWEEATRRIMGQITDVLAEIRGEQPPEVPVVGKPPLPR